MLHCVQGGEETSTTKKRNETDDGEDISLEDFEVKHRSFFLVPTSPNRIADSKVRKYLQAEPWQTGNYSAPAGDFERPTDPTTNLTSPRFSAT